MRQNFQFSSQSLHQTVDHNPQSSLWDDVHQHDVDRPSLFDPTVEWLHIFSSWPLDSKEGCRMPSVSKKESTSELTADRYVLEELTSSLHSGKDLRDLISSDLELSDRFIVIWDSGSRSPCSSRRLEAPQRAGCQLESNKRRHVSKINFWVKQLV